MALLFILLKAPMLGVFFQFMEASVDTEMLARQYIDFLVFGAPAVLGLYSFTGWDERMGKRGKSLSAAVLTVTVLPFQFLESCIPLF